MALRVDILANDKASFIRPMAEGLARMLRAAGARPRLHYDGLHSLMVRQRIDTSSPRRIAGSATRLIGSRRRFSRLKHHLADSDLIVVVANVPGSFSPSLFPNIELLRACFPQTPIVNYDLHYLPTLDSWARHILRGERTGLPEKALRPFESGHFGLERYDWYLMTSVGTYVPLPPGPQPYSLIGIDLDDGTLYPEQPTGRGRVLIDFEQQRGHFPEYRRIQLEAVRRSGLEYETLKGNYSISEIRSIYRRTSIFFLASSEAFGLPVVELQACGSLVFLPDPYWACAHWLGDDFRNPERRPNLSRNFVVYPNDPDSLAEALLRAAETPDPQRVRETLLAAQPELFRGDMTALSSFLSMVESGQIHAGLHREHYPIGRHAPPEP